MKFTTKIFTFFTKGKGINRKTLADYKQEALTNLGREQFKKLLDKGLSIPVVLL